MVGLGAGSLLTRGLGDVTLVTRGLGGVQVPLIFETGRPRQLLHRGGSGRREEIRYDVDDRLAKDEYRITAQLIEVNGKELVMPLEGDTGKVLFDDDGLATVKVKKVEVKPHSVQNEIVIRVRLVRKTEVD